MLASRLRTLSIFAGGCLSGAVLLIVWRVSTEAAPAERVDTRRFTPVVEMPSDAETAPADAGRHPLAKNADGNHASPASKKVEEGTEPEAGRAVSDVLAHLEAAYREQLAAVPASTSDAPASTGALAAANVEQQAPAVAPPTAPLAPATTLPAVPAVAAPARAEAPVAVAAATVPPAVALVAPVVAAPAVAAPAAAPVAALPAAAPAVATAGATSPLATAPGIAPATQNVSVGSIHQGDTYNVQQVAIMQYVPVFAPWAYPGYGYPQQHAPRSSQPKRVPYPTTLTNPDNPWGFAYPPSLEMVK
jgi:hypothetical protein